MSPCLPFPHPVTARVRLARRSSQSWCSQSTPPELCFQATSTVPCTSSVAADCTVQWLHTHTCTLTHVGASAKILMKMAMAKSHLKSSLYATTQPWFIALLAGTTSQRLRYGPSQHLNHAYPTVLYPAFRIQVLFQNLILDPEEWDQISRQREAVTEWQVTDRCTSSSCCTRALTRGGGGAT